MPALGIIGCGTVCTNYYLPVLRNHFHYREIYLFDTDTTRCQHAATKFNARAVSLNELLQQSTHIIIAAPPHAHHELLQQSIAAGKTILCEKPFLLSSAQAQNAINSAQTKECKLFVGHIRRLFPHVRLAQQIIESGGLGKIISINMHEGMRFNYNASSTYFIKTKMGGVLPDTGSHALDMLLHICNLDGNSAQHIAVQRDAPEPAQEVQLHFTLQNNIDVHMHLSRYAPLANKLSVVGEKGILDVPASIRPFVRLQNRGGKTETIPVKHPVVNDMFDAFRLQLETVFIKENTSLLGASQFVSLTGLLEKLYQHNT